MSIENETSDQIVRMILQGSEVVLRLSGEAGMKTAQMIYNALKGDLTTKGRATFWEFLKSGKEQKLFQIPDTHLKAFTMASKKFGFPFVILKDKTKKDGMTTILAYATDASKVDRVIDMLGVNVKTVETLNTELIAANEEYVKAMEPKLKVPFRLIDGIPETPTKDKRLLAELQKYAAKMKQFGPQVVDPVSLVVKENGRYEIIQGQGAKRIMALRLAGYNEVVADIMIPKNKVQVRAENVGERPPQERSETRKEPEKPAPEKPNPTKEEPQSINPTMARTSKDPASGQSFEQKSRKGEDKMPLGDPEKRPSVRKKLEEAKVISAERQAAKDLAKTLGRSAKKSNPR